MVLASRQIMETVRDMVAALPGVSGAQLGEPASIGYTLYGFVLLENDDYVQLSVGPNGRFTDAMQLKATLAYRTGGDVETAEASLAEAKDALKMAFPIGLQIENGKVTSFSVFSIPYMERTASEYREYPFLITITQISQNT